MSNSRMNNNMNNWNGMMQNSDNCNMNNWNNMMRNTDMCECGFDDDSPFPDNYMFGQSYVPIQRMTTTFKPCVGLKMGTIFPELVSPYEPCQSLEEDNFLRCSNEIKEGCNRER